MALIVETGIGVANANAFISLDDADGYFLIRGNAVWAGKPAGDREAAIVRATSYLSNAYDWEGTRTHGRAQALAWPRSGVTDSEEHAVASNEIPWEVQDATCEVAAVELATPGSMTPSVILGERITQETVGSISVSYELGSSAYQSIPTLPLVDDLIGDFLGSGFGRTSLFGRMERV